MKAYCVIVTLFLCFSSMVPDTGSKKERSNSKERNSKNAPLSIDELKNLDNLPRDVSIPHSGSPPSYEESASTHNKNKKESEKRVSNGKDKSKSSSNKRRSSSKSSGLLGKKAKRRSSSSSNGQKRNSNGQKHRRSSSLQRKSNSRRQKRGILDKYYDKVSQLFNFETGPLKRSSDSKKRRGSKDSISSRTSSQNRKSNRRYRRFFAFVIGILALGAVTQAILSIYNAIRRKDMEFYLPKDPNMWCRKMHHSPDEPCEYIDRNGNVISIHRKKQKKRRGSSRPFPDFR